MSTTYNALASAIAQEENSQYPNNPGALEDASGNMLDFGSVENGWNALLNKLSYDASGNSTTYSPGMSLAQFESVYTGGDTNAGNNVSSILGVSPSTPLSQLSDQALGSSNNFAIPDPSLTTELGPGTSISLNPSNNTTTVTTPSGSQTGSASSSGIFGSFETWLSSSSANVVSVLIGLVLIAGAIFSFSTVRDTIVSTAKKGVALAA
jgi:hypothetical protein